MGLDGLPKSVIIRKKGMTGESGIKKAEPRKTLL
jgi:hypothetical protein